MPIWTSLLNNDWYKATMPPVVAKHYGDVVVGSGFTNRNTDFPVADYVDLGELREEFAALRSLRYTTRELDFLRSLDVLDRRWIDGLTDFQMPEIQVERRGHQIHAEVANLWHEQMPAEVPALAIITELVSRKLAQEAGLGPAAIRREGYRQLDLLVAFLRAHPDVKIALFGTRRHFSVAWEYEATAYLVDRVPNQIAGISNMLLAWEFGYPVTGTIAHEMHIVPTMIHIAKDTPNPIGVAQNEVMDYWEAAYAHKWNGGLLCAITDTFGTEAFLRNFSRERAEKWLTYKHDSNTAQWYTDEMILPWLEAQGLDPAIRRINHCDGLNVDTIAQIHANHRGRYLAGYAIGTRSTNNVGVATHSFVWKPRWVMVGDQKVAAVKLSDNVEKGVGEPAMLTRVKQLAGYKETFAEKQEV